MAKDIFQTEVNLGKGWKLDGAIINFGKAKDGTDLNAMLLATSLTVNYNRGTEQINPINSTRRYILASDPQGTIQIGAVIGPSASISKFITQFGDVCKVDENIIEIQPSGTQTCDHSAGGADVAQESNFKSEKWIASGALITGLNMSISKTAGGNMVVANLGLSFMKLEMKPNATKTAN